MNQVMTGSRPQAAGRQRPISAQIKPRNTIITRTNSADGLHVTSARLVSNHSLYSIFIQYQANVGGAIFCLSFFIL